MEQLFVLTEDLYFYAFNKKSKTLMKKSNFNYGKYLQLLKFFVSYKYTAHK